MIIHSIQSFKKPTHEHRNVVTLFVFAVYFILRDLFTDVVVWPWLKLSQYFFVFFVYEFNQSFTDCYYSLHYVLPAPHNFIYVVQINWNYLYYRQCYQGSVGVFQQTNLLFKILWFYFQSFVLIVIFFELISLNER